MVVPGRAGPPICIVAYKYAEKRHQYAKIVKICENDNHLSRPTIFSNFITNCTECKIATGSPLVCSQVIKSNH